MSRFLVIDFETTGFAPPEAEVIEVGMCDFTAGEAIGPRSSQLFGCAGPIPPQTRAIHHITTDDLAGRALCTPDALAEIIQVGAPWDALVAHNATMEGQWLTEDVRRGVPMLCTYKAALRVWPEAPGHSNGCLRYWLEDEGLANPNPKLCQPSHRAGPDAYVTAHLLAALLGRASLEDMLTWTGEPRLLPTCPIGVWRGKRWPEIDVGFLNWILSKADMDPDIVWNTEREIERRRDEYRARQRQLAESVS